MAETNFLISDGDEIVIRVPRGKKPDAENSVTRRGGAMLRARRADDILPRRLKKSGTMQFYDGGFPAAGAELDFYINAGATAGTDGYFTIRPLAGSDYESLVAAVIGDDVTELPERFKKIAKGNSDRYKLKLKIDALEIPLTDAEPKFTENGVQVTDSQLSAAASVEIIHTPIKAAFYSLFFHPSIKVKGTGRNKITSVLDSGAANVAFAPKSSDTYFLMPQLSGAGHAGSFTPGGVGFRFGLNVFWAVEPRRNYFDAAFEFFNVLPAAWVNGFPPSPDSYGTYAEAMAAAAFVRSLALPFPRTMKTESTGAITSVGDYPPVPPFTLPSPGAGGNSLEAFYTGGVAYFDDYNYLVAIIKQGANWFYVWKNEG